MNLRATGLILVVAAILAACGVRGELTPAPPIFGAAMPDDAPATPSKDAR